MNLHRWMELTFATGVLIFSLACHTANHKISAGEESHQELERRTRIKETPYVVMVSIDGFRFDYLDKYKAPNLRQFATEGSRLEALRPTFPSNTFPNHYTLVTGMHAGRHQLVDNKFYSPKLKLDYSLGRRESVVDGRFYSGVPIWNLAESQGLLTAPFFWPGSEADIGGQRPTYYRAYDHNMSPEDKITQIIKWLKLPEHQRPHFTSLYFHDVDSAGHKYGPNSGQVRGAVARVDKAFGQFLQAIGDLKIKVNVLVTSDHGMVTIKSGKIDNLGHIFRSSSEREVLKQFKVVGGSTLIHFYFNGPGQSKNSTVQRLHRILKSKARYSTPYVREEIPENLHYSESPSVGDLVLLAESGAVIRKSTLEIFNSAKRGTHGYNPHSEPGVHGIFLAKGPNIKSGVVLPIQDNVHVYPFVAELLKLQVRHSIDGSLDKLRPMLK